MTMSSRFVRIKQLQFVLGASISLSAALGRAVSKDAVGGGLQPSGYGVKGCYSDFVEEYLASEFLSLNPASQPYTFETQGIYQALRRFVSCLGFMTPLYKTEWTNAGLLRETCSSQR